MITTLAISLSTPFGSIAITTPNGSEQTMLNGVQQHSAHFFTELDLLLARHQLSAQNIQRIAVDIGPGSFIGVRSSVSITQALAFVNQCPIHAFNSLDILAHQTPLSPNQWLLTAQDARMGECYYALWQQRANRLHNVIEPAVDTAESIDALLTEYNATTALRVGSAFDNNTISVQAVSLLDRVHQTPAIQPEALTPLYIRNNVANKPQSN